MGATTVVAVPGNWKDDREIVAAIASPTQDPEYLFAGAVMLELATHENMPLQIRPHDPNLAKAFRWSGAYSNFSEADFTAIAGCTHCLYLVEKDGGSKNAAIKVMRFAAKLLRAGGLAVKVDSAGKSHTASNWLALTKAAIGPNDGPKITALFEAFVVLVGDVGTGYYSCGMHNLGLPDASLAPGMANNEAGTILRGFLKYMLLEQPKLRSRETFSLSTDSPHFELNHCGCRQFPKDDLRHNPFGVWAMSPC